MNNISSAITVDVEDGINIAMRDHFNVNILPTDRVIKNTSRLLELFGRYNVKATFFILGQVAENYPSIVKQVYNEGHEVGVHGYDHIQFFKLSPKEVKADLLRAKNIIEDLLGEEVKGFRAPAFSVIPNTAWALDIIAEAGFIYDSSIMPASTGRYGWPGFPEKIQELQLPNGLKLIEVPLTTTKFLGRSIPVAGGGYLRLFPYWFTTMAIRRIQKSKPVIIYMHPYEIDIDRYPAYFYEAKRQSSIKKQLLLKSIRFKKETVLPKLEKLIKHYSFDRLDKIVRNYIENEKILVTDISNII